MARIPTREQQLRYQLGAHSARQNPHSALGCWFHQRRRWTCRSPAGVTTDGLATGVLAAGRCWFVRFFFPIGPYSLELAFPFLCSMSPSLLSSQSVHQRGGQAGQVGGVWRREWPTTPELVILRCSNIHGRRRPGNPFLSVTLAKTRRTRRQWRFRGILFFPPLGQLWSPLGSLRPCSLGYSPYSPSCTARCRVLGS